MHLTSKQPMIINIKAKKDRKKTAKQPSKKGCGGSHGSHQKSDFCRVLNKAVRKCKLAKSYDAALHAWHTASFMALDLGCPFKLVKKYEEKLESYFEVLRERESKHYLDIIHDNHGEINH